MGYLRCLFFNRGSTVEFVADLYSVYVDKIVNFYSSYVYVGKILDIHSE